MFNIYITLLNKLKDQNEMLSNIKVGGTNSDHYA